VSHLRSPIWQRRALALLRLVLLYGILCGLLLAGGLLWRGLQQDGWLLPDKTAATGLPFAGINVDPLAVGAGQRQKTLSALRRAGFDWVRLRFDWGTLEPQPGVYDWAAADAWIDDIVDAGLVPLVVLDGSPAGARAEQDRAPSDNTLAPPADPQDMARFAAAFAARYAPKVRYYQVWDEPNIAPHWGNHWIEPVAYAQLLKAVAPAIRAADPDAVIAAAALAPTADRGHTAIDEIYFLQRMVAAGAADSFDAVAIQPFGFGYAPGNARQLPSVLDFQRAALVRRALVGMGLGDKPLWAVRYGWNREPNSVWGAVTPQAQAGYATDASDLAWRRWPWLEALGWAVDRPAEAPGDPHWGFALSSPGGAPAPVLAALAKWLASPRPAVGEGTSGASAPGPWLAWLPLAAGLAAAIWRSAAAARLLPWAQWLGDWRGLLWPLHLAGWAGLLLLYYFAVWPPLVGLCWLLWALMCLAQPRVGLAVAAGLLPFYFQHKELYLVDTVVAVPPAAAAAACLLPALLLRARQYMVRFAAVDAAILGLFAASLFAAARVWNWPAYWQGMVDLVLVPLALWFAFRILDAGHDGGLTARLGGFAYVVGLALFTGGALAAAWGLAAWLSGHGVDVDGVRRLVGPHFSPNHTALYLLRTLFLGIGLAATFSAAGADRWRPGLGILLWAATALVLLALVLTGSRGALLLGLPLGIVVIAWGILRRRPTLLRKPLAHGVTHWVVLGGCLAVAAAVLLLHDRLLNHQTFNLRVDLWAASLRLWRDHLLLGVGPGGFFWTYPAYLDPNASVEPNQLHPHNVWLEVLTTWGLLGAVWLGLLLWSVTAHLKNPVRRRKQPAPVDWFGLGLAAALLAAFAHAQVDAFFLLPDLAAWNALALALLVNRSEQPYSAG
jgi:O-antigen ligase